MPNHVHLVRVPEDMIGLARALAATPADTQALSMRAIA